MLALINNEENAAEGHDVEADNLEAAAKGVSNLYDEIDSRIYEADKKRYLFLIIHLTFDSF